MNYPLMNSPIQIGKLKLKNRIVFPPMNTNFFDEFGHISPVAEAYYVRRARGGASLIVIEAASVTPVYKNHPAQPMLCDRTGIPAWAYLTEKLHRYGAAVTVELVHYGAESELEPHTSPSGISRHKNCSVLTIDEIHEVEEQFITAAVNAYDADLDAVTLHATHGYLLAEFISPLYNQRTDEYGGSTENRCRIVTNIIKGIHAKLGNGFPVIPRITSKEYIQGGSDTDYAAEVAKILVAAGANAIDISASTPSAYMFTTPSYIMPEAKVAVIEAAEKIKKVVDVPVFAAIGIRTPGEVESLIAEGKADLISLGRGLIADPDFIEKATSGEEKCIHECLSCMHCLNTLNSGKGMRCAVNPEIGRETEYDGIAPADVKKKILVVGGGPSGMEAAVVSAKRGHTVLLAEKLDKLGGSILAAEIPAHKEQLSKMIARYEYELQKYGVEIKLGIEDVNSLIDQWNPDHVIVATGASYIRRIKGSDGPTVVTAIDALKDPSIVGRKVVIIGGGATGCETAEYLRGTRVEIKCLGASKIGGALAFEEKAVEYKGADIDVTIVEMLPAIASDMDEFTAPSMLKSLESNGVHMYAATRVEEITEEGVRATILEGSREVFFPADTVILAGGLIPNPCTIKEGVSFTNAGDTVKPGKIANAVYTGYLAARDL